MTPTLSDFRWIIKSPDQPAERKLLGVPAVASPHLQPAVMIAPGRWPSLLASIIGFSFGLVMERDKVTKQLERIIGAIESGAIPWRIHELHVFGSYARGAVHPDDLDLILIHEPLTDALVEQIAVDAKTPHLPRTEFERRLRRLLWKPGEKIDMVVGESLPDILRRLTPDRCVLVWSETDRDWRPKLAAITPDPQAGRHPRDHFANIRRFKTDLKNMESATSAIDRGLLRLTRVPLDTINLDDLNLEYRDRLARWTWCLLLGKESMKLLPYGMWWIQQQEGQHQNPPHAPARTCEMTSHDGRFSVLMGKPSLWPILGWREATKAICLIPHLKRGEPNELLVFERGPHYTDKRMEDHLAGRAWPGGRARG